MKECPRKISSACRPRSPEARPSWAISRSIDETDDARLRVERLAGGTCGVDRREVSRLVGFGGDVEKKFSKDELLTNIMIYWVTESGPSSVRLYFENRVDSGLTGRVESRSPAPAFRARCSRSSPPWIEAQYNLQQLTDMPSGGFAAMEEPQLTRGGRPEVLRGRR